MLLDCRSLLFAVCCVCSLLWCWLLCVRFLSLVACSLLMFVVVCVVLCARRVACCVVLIVGCCLVRVVLVCVVRGLLLVVGG